MFARLGRIFRILNSPCKDMSHRISHALDDELPPAERFALRLHLLYCTSCRRYKRQVSAIRAAFRDVAERLHSDTLRPGPTLSSAARARILHAVRDR